MWSERVEVVRMGEKAVLVRYEGIEVWIPYSQLLDDSEVCQRSEPGEECSLVIPDWLAEAKGLMI